jgi:hypothetical protein
MLYEHRQASCDVAPRVNSCLQTISLFQVKIFWQIDLKTRGHLVFLPSQLRRIILQNFREFFVSWFSSMFSERKASYSSYFKFGLNAIASRHYFVQLAE